MWDCCFDDVVDGDDDGDDEDGDGDDGIDDDDSDDVSDGGIEAFIVAIVSPFTCANSLDVCTVSLHTVDAAIDLIGVADVNGNALVRMTFDVNLSSCPSFSW